MIKELTRRLREKYGCKTIKEGKALLKKKQKQELIAHKKYAVLRETFLKKWKGK